jgi:hypothetical protein
MDIAMLIDKGLYVLLGVLVTAVTNHFLSKSRERQVHKIISFHGAAEKFRHSFDDALLNIEQGEHPVHELLRNFFLPHKVAMWHFKYYFIGKARKRFEKTWNEYETYYNENYEKGSAFASFASAKTEHSIQKLNEYRKHIENLIKYTI